MNFKKLVDILIELKLKKFERSLALLNDFNLDGATLPEKSFYLWLKLQICKKIETSDEVIIDEIKENWDQIQPNLLNESADIWTSNLANYYACLGEVKNTLGLLEVQKTMTDIRDFIFDNMIDGSRLYGQLSTKAVTHEQLLSVLPFGLFAPEDLIVVAAHEALLLHSLECPVSNAIFGIYFTEKFELDQANAHLNKALQAAKEDTAGESLIKLLRLYMQEKTGDQAVEFIHKPVGHFNVYDTLNCERHPHYPLVDQQMKINVQVVGTKEAPELILDQKRYNGLLTDEKEQIYSFEILADQKMNQQSYHFEIQHDESTFKSENYLLELSACYDIHAIKFLGSNEAENIYEVINDIQRIYLLLKSDEFEVSIQYPNIAHDQVNPNHLIFDENSCSLKSSKHQFNLCKCQPIVMMGLVDQGVTSFKINLLDDERNGYFGFGERYNKVNQFGEEIDCYVYNQYRDQGTKTYLPMPYFITSHGWGVFVETDNYTTFNLQKRVRGIVSISVDFEANKPAFSFVLLKGQMKEMISSFIERVGEPHMLPAWAFGPWMSSNNWDRDHIVRAEVEKTVELDIPATVIVLEQWSDETTYYMFNDAEYEEKHSSEAYTNEEIHYPSWGRWPDPKGLVDYCHDHQLKFILWQVPIHKYLNGNRHPLKDRDEKYMLEQGYAVKKADGSPYRIPENWYTDSLLLDFTNEEARKWWFSKRQYLVDIGVDGFKTDGGEMVFGGKETRFSDGSTGLTMRNKYVKDYISSYYEFAQQRNGMTFSRAGYTGAGQFPAHWAGDERSTFDAFQRSLKAGINAGMSGVLFWGWDLGGFNGDIPTAELFIRSAQMAAFCPIMQYHAESKGEFNQDRTPWNIAERTGKDEAISVYRKYANIRMNLLPYIYSESKRAIANKQPLMKAMVIEYPTEGFDEVYDQYFFGENLLIAPVTCEGATRRTVLLPKGRWTHLFSKEIFDGDQQLEVIAELEDIPVFVKENSVVMMNLGNDKMLGSSIGNSLESYKHVRLFVTVKDSFTTTIEDYLGNVVTVNVVKEESIQVEVNGLSGNFELEVVEL